MMTIPRGGKERRRKKNNTRTLTGDEKRAGRSCDVGRNVNVVNGCLTELIGTRKVATKLCVAPSTRRL